MTIEPERGAVAENWETWHYVLSRSNMSELGQ